MTARAGACRAGARGSVSRGGRAGRAAAVGLLAALAGCGPILVAPTPPDIVAADQRAAERDGYRLTPGDQIEVHHLVDTDYSAIVAVAPDGRVTVPGIAAPVQAAGLTAGELTAALAPLYARDGRLRDPQFSVLLRSAAAQQIFVGGEVARPGFLDLPGGPRRVTQVLAAAGWLLPTARRHEVILVRNGVDGRPIVFSVDVAKIENGTDLAQNVLVRPSDTVLVPKSDIASLDTWVDQYLRESLPLETSGDITYQVNNAAGTATSFVK